MHRATQGGIIAVGAWLACCGVAAAEVPVAGSVLRGSVGVNTHAAYYDTSYARWGEVLAELRTLGISHIRDGIELRPDGLVDNELRSRLVRVAGQGVRLNLLVGAPGTDVGRLLDVVESDVGPAVDSVEAPNEIDVQRPDQFPGPVTDYVRALARALTGRLALQVPLLAPSLSLVPSFDRLGLLSADRPLTANVHYYTRGMPPTEASLREAVARARVTAGAGAPVQITETGFADAGPEPGNEDGPQAGVPPDVVAAYSVRVLLEALRLGVARTYLYELLDEKPDPDAHDAEQHFGLLSTELEPKLAFSAVQRLLASAGTGDSAEADVPIGVTAPDGVHHVLIDAGEGQYRVPLWRETSLWDPVRRTRLPAEDVPVTISTPVGRTAAQLDLVTGVNTPLALANGLVRVRVGPSPTIVSFAVPAPMAPPASGPTGTQSLPATPTRPPARRRRRRRQTVPVRRTPQARADRRRPPHRPRRRSTLRPFAPT